MGSSNRSVGFWSALLITILACAGLVIGGGTPVTYYIPDWTSLSSTQITDLYDTHQLYFNVQSPTFVNGEIRGEISPSASHPMDNGNPFAANPAQNPVTYAALLGGNQVRLRNIVTSATAYGSVTVDPLTKNLTGCLVSSGITGTAASINDGLPGTNGKVEITLEGGPVVWSVPADTYLTDEQMARLSTGAYYFNIRSTAFPGGELRGQLDQQVRFSSLNSSNLVPPGSSSATGTGVLALSPQTNNISGFVKTNGLDSSIIGVVLNRGSAGSGGSFVASLKNNGNGIWSIPPNTILPAAQVANFNNNGLYFQVHTQSGPGGELRGQLLRSEVKIGRSSLDGYQEIPPVSTLATGSGMFAWNSITGQVSGSLVADNVSTTSASIHSGSSATNGPALIDMTTASPVTVAPLPGISYGLDIQPIFTGCSRSTFCHATGGAAPMSLKSGVSYPNAFQLLAPGNAASSYLFQRITIDNPPSFPQMPLNRPPLTVDKQNLVRDWINSGALFDFYPAEVSMTPNLASPQSVGTPITFTASVLHGVGPYEYRFWLNNGSGFSIVQNYGPASSWVWTPTTSGAYDVMVDVRTIGTSELRETFTKVFYYKIEPNSVTSVTANTSIASPQQAGTPIMISASGQGGSGNYEYRFWLNSGTGYNIVQNYGTANTYAWTPTTAGAYDILVDVRNAGSTAVRDAFIKIFFYKILPSAATGVTLTPSLTSPQSIGTPIIFTATGEGGSGTYEYRFWLNSGSGYAIAQGYSNSNTFTWNPSTTGAYDILVDVRNAGSTTFRESFKKVLYYRIQ